jgi:hypothetical protein
LKTGRWLQALPSTATEATCIGQALVCVVCVVFSDHFFF